MKIDKNAPAFPTIDSDTGAGGSWTEDSGLPARLLIAAMLMAGRGLHEISLTELDGTVEGEEWDIALHWADVGIARHNATCEEPSDA